MARLVIYSSGAPNQTVELTGRNVRIGRAKENDIVLADAAQVVSRFHAELRYEDGRYILLDLNSANGTWVWDHRIQRIVVDSSTVAEIGSYRLVFETETEATTVPPESRHQGPPKPTAPLMPASGTPAVSPVPESPDQNPPPTRVPVPAPRAEPPPVSAVATAPPRVSAPAGVADDSASTAARVLIQPAAEASTTGVDRGVRSGGSVWPPKRRTMAGIALLVFALVAVGFAVGARFLTGGRNDEGTRPNPAPAATPAASAPAEPEAAPGSPAEPPVVPARTSAEKQEVAAPAVSPPPATAPRRSGRPAPSRPTDPALPADARLDAVRVVPGLARRPGESPTEYVARAARLQTLYGDARAALQAKDFVAATRLFERLEAEQSGLFDVADRLAEARDGARAVRRAEAEAAMAGGEAAEQRGDFVEAQRAYERAAEADPASGAAEALGRVRARMKALGDDAFKRAKTFDALGRSEDAIAQYERAVQLLAPDDPNRKTAKQRLDVLRAGIIIK